MTTLQTILLVFFLVLLILGPRAIIRVSCSLLLVGVLIAVAVSIINKASNDQAIKDHGFGPDKFTSAEWHQVDEQYDWARNHGASAGLTTFSEGHPKVYNKAQYDALPNGTWFMWYWDLEVYAKVPHSPHTSPGGVHWIDLDKARGFVAD